MIYTKRTFFLLSVLFAFTVSVIPAAVKKEYNASKILSEKMPAIKKIRGWIQGTEWILKQSSKKKESLITASFDIPIMGHIVESMSNLKNADLFSPVRLQKLWYAFLFAPDQIPILLREVAPYIKLDQYDFFVDTLEEIVKELTAKNRTKDEQSLISSYIYAIFNDVQEFLNAPDNSKKHFKSDNLIQLYQTLVNKEIRDSIFTAIDPLLKSEPYQKFLNLKYGKEKSIIDRYKEYPLELLVDFIFAESGEKNRKSIAKFLKLLNINTLFNSDVETATEYIKTLRDNIENIGPVFLVTPLSIIRSCLKMTQQGLDEFLPPADDIGGKATRIFFSALFSELISPLNKAIKEIEAAPEDKAVKGKSNLSIAIDALETINNKWLESAALFLGKAPDQAVHLHKIINFVLVDLWKSGESFLKPFNASSKVQKTYEDIFEDDSSWKSSLNKLIEVSSNGTLNCVELYYEIKNGNLRSEELKKRAKLEEHDENFDDYDIFDKLWSGKKLSSEEEKYYNYFSNFKEYVDYEKNLKDFCTNQTKTGRIKAKNFDEISDRIKAVELRNALQMLAAGDLSVPLPSCSEYADQIKTMQKRVLAQKESLLDEEVQTLLSALKWNSPGVSLSSLINRENKEGFVCLNIDNFLDRIFPQQSVFEKYATKVAQRFTIVTIDVSDKAALSKKYVVKIESRNRAIEEYNKKITEYQALPSLMFSNLPEEEKKGKQRKQDSLSEDIEREKNALRKKSKSLSAELNDQQKHPILKSYTAEIEQFNAKIKAYNKRETELLASNTTEQETTNLLKDDLLDLTQEADNLSLKIRTHFILNENEEESGLDIINLIIDSVGQEKNEIESGVDILLKKRLEKILQGNLDSIIPTEEKGGWYASLTGYNSNSINKRYASDLDEIKEQAFLQRNLLNEIEVKEYIAFLNEVKNNNLDEKIIKISHPTLKMYDEQTSQVHKKIQEYKAINKKSSKAANIKLKALHEAVETLIFEVENHHLMESRPLIKKIIEEVKQKEFKKDLLTSIEELSKQQATLAQCEERKISHINTRELLLKEENNSVLSALEKQHMVMLQNTAKIIHFSQENVLSIDEFLERQKQVDLHSFFQESLQVIESDTVEIENYKEIFESMRYQKDIFGDTDIMTLESLIAKHDNPSDSEDEEIIKAEKEKSIKKCNTLFLKIREELLSENLYKKEELGSDETEIEKYVTDNKEVFDIHHSKQMIEEYQAAKETLKAQNKISKEELQAREWYLLKLKKIHASNFELLSHKIKGSFGSILPSAGLVEKSGVYFNSFLPEILNASRLRIDKKYALQFERDLPIAKKLVEKELLTFEEQVIYEKEKEYFGNIDDETGLVGYYAAYHETEEPKTPIQIYLVDQVKKLKKRKIFDLLWTKEVNVLEEEYLPKKSFTSEEKQEIIKLLELFEIKDEKSKPTVDDDEENEPIIDYDVDIDEYQYKYLLNYFRKNQGGDTVTATLPELQNLFNESKENVSDEDHTEPEAADSNLLKIISDAEKRSLDTYGFNPINSYMSNKELEDLIKKNKSYKPRDFKVQDRYSHMPKSNLSYINYADYFDNSFMLTIAEKLCPDKKRSFDRRPTVQNMKTIYNLIAEQAPMLQEMFDSMPEASTPDVSEFERYIDEVQNSDRETIIKRKDKEKKKEEKKAEKRKKKQIEIENEVNIMIPANNSPLIEVPLPLTENIKVGLTPYDLKKLLYDFMKSYVESNVIDAQVDTFKKEEVQKRLLKDNARLLQYIKNVSPAVRRKLKRYIKSGGTKHGRELAIIDDRQKEKASMFQRFFFKKKSKRATQKASSVNSLRNYFDGQLTPLLDNPKQMVTLRALLQKTLFNSVVDTIEETVIGKSTGLLTYKQNGTGYESNNHITFTPTNFSILSGAFALLDSKSTLFFAKLQDTNRTVQEYCKNGTLGDVLKNKMGLLPENVQMIGSGFLSNFKPSELAELFKSFFPEEILIALGGKNHLLAEYAISNLLFTTANGIVEYILFDKLSGQQLSHYFQKNISTLEEILNEYKDAQKINDKAGVAYAEYRFSKFIEKSKVAPVSNKIVSKLLPKFLFAYNLTSRVLFNNDSLEFVSILTKSLFGKKVPKIVLSGGFLATALGIYYNMWQSVDGIYKDCNGAE